MHWYVARAHHGMAEQADWEIRDAGFDVLTARIFKPAVPARRSAGGALLAAQEERFDLLFVRYIVVRFCFPGPAWSKIVALASVERIIAGGHTGKYGTGTPVAVPDIAIERVRKLLDATGVLFPPGYHGRIPTDAPIETGTELHIPDGPFADRAAVCAASDGERIIMTMDMMFNRDNVPVHTTQSTVQVL